MGNKKDRTPSPAPAVRWLTAAEVAAELRLNVVTVYRLVDAGKLPGVRIGRIVRIRRDKLDAFLNQPSSPPEDKNGR